MPIQTFEFLNYYAIVVAVGKDQVFLPAGPACAQFEIFVVKVGST